MNSDNLCLGTNSKLRSKCTDGHVSSQGRRTKETAFINKCFTEDIRIEHELDNWPRPQSSMQSWLVFHKCNQIPAYAPVCKAMLSNIQRLKNHRQFPSLKAILENLFFKCNYLRMRRVSHDELKSTKLALQQNA